MPAAGSLAGARHRGGGGARHTRRTGGSVRVCVSVNTAQYLPAQLNQYKKHSGKILTLRYMGAATVERDCSYIAERPSRAREHAQPSGSSGRGVVAPPASCDRHLRYPAAVTHLLRARAREPIIVRRPASLVCAAIAHVGQRSAQGKCDRAVDGAPLRFHRLRQAPL
jgi:hypothetical protein